MSHEEKNTILQIVIGAAINIWLVLEIKQLYSEGFMEGPTAIQIWAETVFWIIIIAVVAGIGLTIIGAGFIVLILGLKFGYKPIDCLILLMFSFSLGGLAGEMAKLARYRMSF